MDILSLFTTLSIELNTLYIDPASTSVLLSSLTAIGVALGATLMISYRKFKKKCANVIDLDEEEKTVSEEELKIYSEDDINAEIAVTDEKGVESLRF